MRCKIIFAVLLCAALSVQAADRVTPLDVKVGLWEITTTHSMTGQIPMSPEQLAKLTPEQRASLEKGLGNVVGPTTKTHKECITREKLEKDLVFGTDRPGCSRTVLTSTSNKFEAKLHCEEKGSKTDGTLVLDVLDSEKGQGTMEAVASNGERTMNVHVSFSTKYLAAACGDIKP